MTDSVFDKFLIIAHILNRKLGIVPLLYGSLGLEILTGIETNPEDIDVLIPERFINERWKEIRSVMENQGYEMVDEQEHEFLKENHKIAFSHIEDLEDFAGIKPVEIEERRKGSIRYKLLNLQQYLQVYRKSIKDGYRIEIRNKKDGEKIELIKGLLES